MLERAVASLTGEILFHQRFPTSWLFRGFGGSLVLDRRGSELGQRSRADLDHRQCLDRLAPRVDLQLLKPLRLGKYLAFETANEIVVGSGRLAEVLAELSD